jgi:hypothetical protein
LPNQCTNHPQAAASSSSSSTPDQVSSSFPILQFNSLDIVTLKYN